MLGWGVSVMILFSSRLVLGVVAAVTVMQRDPAIVEAQSRSDRPLPSSADKQVAKKLVAAGIAAQDAQQYDTAIELYHKAYTLVPHPILLFNIGQAHRLAGRPNQAQRFYERYLKREPNGSQSAVARAALAAIKARRPERTGASGDAPRKAGPLPTPPDQNIVSGTTSDETDSSSEDEVENPEDENEKTRLKAKEQDVAVEELQNSPMTASGVYSSGERAVDVVAGLSFTTRWLTFHYDAEEVASKPSGYKLRTPAIGLYVDANIFPFALGHDREDPFRYIGVALMYDRAVLIRTQLSARGMEVDSTAQRYMVGFTFRYPLGSKPAAPMIGTALRYGRQEFTIDGDTEAPNVNYSMIDLSGFFNYTIGPNVTFSLKAAVLLPRDAGAITKPTEFGHASSWGIEGSFGADFALSKNIFARVSARIETILYSFDGGGMKSLGVQSAQDTYFGGTLTLGYLL
jgi:tetratricopeptide (TPR) repeat protein